jgi:cytoplasmic iron level regulating protein YaaA (DUF328/UPF0246 family)
MLILLHTSKAMRSAPMTGLRAPLFIEEAKELDGYLKSLSPAKLTKMMSLSPSLAEKTRTLIRDWTSLPSVQTPAIDSFIGDIYSGMQAPTFTAGERKYADQHLRILSGLYGLLRPLDGIAPYRLEMGYKLPGHTAGNLYDYWGDRVAKALPRAGSILNLTAVEYSDVVTPYIDNTRLIAPRFMTVSPKTGEPAFVVVHAKIARGTFARWMITNKIDQPTALPDFAEIGYRYAKKLSKPAEPVFVCKEFGGTGLSIRMQDK